MQLDIPDILAGLAKKRPVFHSEADFRTSLALHLHETYKHLYPLPEYPFALPENIACDIMLLQGGKEVMALELKYFCRAFKGEVGDKFFRLRWNSTPDAGRYGVLKDIERMEIFLEKNPTAQAAVIAITNDPKLWEGKKSKNTTDAAFVLQEGGTVTGTLAWAPHTSLKTKRAYPKIILRGKYDMAWQDYSRLDGTFGKFRFLHIPVSKP